MSAPLVFDVLLEASGRALLVAGFVTIALAVFRAKAPAVRHAAWTAAMATMLVLPLMSGWLPSVELPIRLPSPSLQQMAVDGVPGAAIVYHWVPPLPATPSSPVAPVSAGLSPTLSRSVPIRPSATLAPASPRQAWRLNVLFVWLVVASLLLLREAIGWRLAHRLAAQSVPAAIGDGTHESDRVTTPVVTGVLRPRILVPGSWSQWGSGVRRMILAHERAHMARRDSLVAALARVNRSIFWFHPLAWWMERHLSRLAERACDELVVRELKDSRLYAALLVEMAHRLQQHGQRVAWQGIGIVSGRPFEDRLDRILEGPAPDLSGRSKFALALACSVLMAIGVACGSASTDVTGGSAAPLAQDPELAKDIATREARAAEYEAAIAMTLEQVAALEKTVAANPDDLDATRKLLMFYRQSGQRLMGWNQMVAARRPHLLRLIARHPESDLTRWPFARRLDPDGWEQARALWMAHVERADVNSKVLGQAAAFFEISEKPEAERLLQRAYALDPTGPQPRVASGVYYAPWLNRLGVLYAKAIVGSDDETVFNVVKSVSKAEAQGAFAQHARSELAKTTSSTLLASAGGYLTRNASQAKLDFDHRALGRSYLEKAVTLQPVSPVAIWSLEQTKRSLAHNKDHERTLEQLGKTPSQLNRTEFDRLSVEMKIAHGHELLWAPYTEAMWAYQKPDPAGVGKDQAEVRRRAEVAEALAEFRRRADVMDQVARKAGVPPAVAAGLGTDVHLARAAYAMRQGDRAEAVRRLGLAASTAPVHSPDGVGVDDAGLAYHRAIELTWELLEAGERESIASYYDAVAKVVRQEQRATYETASAAIRAGKMPASYQHYVARLK